MSGLKPPSESDPILVWGAGAIGGTIAAYLARAGIPVKLVDVVEGHVEACRTAGLRIEGAVDIFTQVIPAVTPGELKGTYSRILLAVKAQHTAGALESLLPHLAADGCILSAQNGLNEILIAEKAGANRTIGCYLGFGSDWIGPGQIRYGGRGEVVIGELDGKSRPRTVELHELLKLFEPNAILTDNIWGYLWSKLGLAAILFATALDNDGMDVSIGDPARFPVFDRLGREVMAVAHARKVTPVGFTNFDPLAFMPGTPQIESRAAVETLSHRWDNNAKKHSGFWRDLAVRKRRTEVDFLVAPVAELGMQAGIDTPVIRTLLGLVHDIEAGRREQSLDTFKILLDECCEVAK